jgi:hypothetical protein
MFKKKSPPKIQLVDLLNDLQRDESAKDRIVKQLSNNSYYNSRPQTMPVRFEDRGMVSSVMATTFLSSSAVYDWVRR